MGLFVFYNMPYKIQYYFILPQRYLTEVIWFLTHHKLGRERAHVSGEVPTNWERNKKRIALLWLTNFDTLRHSTTSPSLRRCFNDGATHSLLMSLMQIQAAASYNPTTGFSQALRCFDILARRCGVCVIGGRANDAKEDHRSTAWHHVSPDLDLVRFRVSDIVCVNMVVYVIQLHNTLGHFVTPLPTRHKTKYMRCVL